MDSTGRYLRDWVKEEGLKDMWEGEGVATRVDPSGGRQSHIDFMFVSWGVRGVRKVVGDVGFSDHQMLRVQVEVGEGGKWGRGVWKLNLKLVEDEGRCEELRELYRGWRTLWGLFATRWEWWVMVRGRVKEWFIKEGRRRAREGIGKETGLCRSC